MQTSRDYLHIFLDMGEALLNSGAEIFRVEDTLNRMGYACGAVQMNVFVSHPVSLLRWNSREKEHGHRLVGSERTAEMILPN